MSCSEWKDTEVGRIPNHWEVVQLSDVVEVQNGYAFKSKFFSSEGNPIIKIKNVKRRVVDLEDCQLYPLELCDKLEKFKIKNNDILIAMTGAGSVGRVSKFICKDNKDYYLNQRVGRVIPNKNRVNNEYLNQLISTEKYEKILFDLANGSGQPNLSPALIGLVKIPLPPLEEQEKIANILSSLDDKIELNNEMNKTLEEMAQSIFKRWFVDFEFPNEDGKPYKPSGGEMVESELGMIPKGWEVKTISDVGEVVGGGTPSTKNEDYYGGDISWITPKDLSGYDRKFISKGERSITELGLEKSSAKLLPKGTVLFSSRAPIGYVAISEQEVCTNQGFKSIVCNSNIINNNYVYYFLKLNKENIENISSGSTFKEISGTHMKNLKIIVPKKEILDRFNEIIISYDELLSKSYEEIDNLSEIKDSLLPKLMSGEISV